MSSLDYSILRDYILLEELNPKDPLLRYMTRTGAGGLKLTDNVEALDEFHAHFSISPESLPPSEHEQFLTSKEFRDAMIKSAFLSYGLALRTRAQFYKEMFSLPH
ncbi:hypothetical protein JW711_02115 [Candidatus Woesearchaeota archaeon]|nr:hypothetical protein [Candidatus Woesearchaeota archaeon]